MKLETGQGYTGVQDALYDETGRMVAKVAHSLPEYERVKLAKALADAFNGVSNMRGLK